MLIDLHESASMTVLRAPAFVADKDETEAENVSSMKGISLIASEPNRPAAFSAEIEVIDKPKRIYCFATRMAKTSRSD